MHSLAAREHKPLTMDPDSNRPGLILSADDGVCFTSNGRPPLLVTEDDPAGPTHRCVYALECDPTKDKEESRRNKEASFGGSDGAEFIPYESDTEPCIKHWLEANEGRRLLAMDLTEDNYTLIGTELRPVLDGAVQKAAGAEFDPAFAEGIRWKAWNVPVVEMDRRGLIAYIGALKLQLAEGRRKLELAAETNKALSALLHTKEQDGRGNNTAAATEVAAPASRRGSRRPKSQEAAADPTGKPRAQRAVPRSRARSAGV